jgi:acyl-CoA dehydrogenase
VAESDNIVAETAEKIFADLADAQTINSDKKGNWQAPLWKALSEAGLPLSWVPESCGGSGASLAEGFSVLSAAGRFAVAVPLAETMLAGWLLSLAKIASPEGPMTVAPASPKDRITLNADGTLSGRARDVPFAKDARHIAVLAHGSSGLSIALVDAAGCRIEAGLNLASDPSDTVTLNNIQPAAIAPCTWWAIAEPFSAASEQRIFADAASRNTSSSNVLQLAIASAADVAAANAAADSPASLARLCCTAWNFDIFFSNATRSFE